MFEETYYFKKIIETGNITKASKELHISQPALSIFLRKTEKHFGTQLITRSRTGISPTRSGKIFYEYCKKILTISKTLLKRVNEINEKENSNINIGMIDNVAEVVIDTLHKNFLKKHNDINLNVEIDNSTRLTESVEKGSLDFAIITKSNSRKLSNKFKQEIIGIEKMYFVCHRELTENIQKLKDIEKFRFLSYDRNSTTGKNINLELKKKKIRIKNIAYSTSPILTLKLLEEKFGVAVLPENIIKRSKKLQILNFRGFNITRELLLIRLKETYLSKNEDTVIDIIRNCYAKMQVLSS